MNCCDTKVGTSTDLKTIHRRPCPVCQGGGDVVSLRTVYHHVLADHLNRIREKEYWFCNSSNCDVVYFGLQYEPFRTGEVREIVSVKHKDQKFPLCYCFGFDSSHVRKAALQPECPKTSQVIRNLVSAGMCECETRNPTGKCCLGAVVAFEKAL